MTRTAQRSRRKVFRELGSDVEESEILCGKIDLFSIDMLITMLDRAGVRVEVSTSPREVA